MAHGPIVRPPVNRDVESSFLSNNDNVEFVPFDLCWLPFKITPPTEGRVDFVQGIKTILGQGDSTTKEGVAVHIYTANTSMTNRALVNGDGDMLIIPQTGRLDIQTELGK